ncbi:MAG: hypothetical protein ACI9U2_004834 [Bradymonadia bacterium]|jgi:hypothetical protein
MDAQKGSLMMGLRDAAPGTLRLIGLVLLANCASQTALLDDPICEDVHWTTQRLRVHQARAHGAVVYVLGQAPPDSSKPFGQWWWRDWVLLRIQPDLTVEPIWRLPRDAPATTRSGDPWRDSVTLAVSNSGEPALAWQRREGGMLQLVVWRARADGPIAVDTLVQAPRLAEASINAHHQVTLVPHGAADFAIAWRPLVDCGFDNFAWSPVEFPAHESHWWPRAEVRWGVVRGPQTVMQRWTTVAHPIGPQNGTDWRFSGLRIIGSQVDGRAAFVWSTFKWSPPAKRLMAVFADATQPTTLMAAPSWAPELMTSGSGDVLVSATGERWSRHVLGAECTAPASPVMGPVSALPAVGPVDVRGRVSPR